MSRSPRGADVGAAPEGGTGTAGKGDRPRAVRALFVLVHSPLVGPYSWARVAEALRDLDHPVVVPRVRSLEQEGAPFWERHVEAITRAVASRHPEEVVLVGHSGAGRLLPISGERIAVPISAYVFVDADIPVRTESRLDAMPPEVAQQFREADRNGLLPPWPEDVFKHEIHDDEVRSRLVAELSPLPLAVYEEPIPLPAGWPDARCAYVRLSGHYPEAEARAESQGWPIHGFDGDHFFILVGPGEVASALVDIASGTD